MSFFIFLNLFLDTVEDQPQSIKMIKVSKIPEGSSEDSIRFFFENKRKSGGGDIEDLDYDMENHTAIITFEEDEGLYYHVFFSVHVTKVFTYHLKLFSLKISH